MNDILKWLLFIGGSIAAYFEPLQAVMLLVTMLFMLDFATGIAKAVRLGTPIKSSKLKWSLYKLLVYLGTMTLTFFICESMRLSKDTSVSVVNVEAWFVVYIEGLSIIENLQKIRDNRFLQFIHYLLAVEFLKRFRILADFMKQEEKDN
ncbi:MAG: phage holin family protein [Prevotellaceae bacterium]|jgi:phage-related holin|nr:phage holin family protein [Prevotellaceae bacterium]